MTFHLQFKIDKDAPTVTGAPPTGPRTATAGTTRPSPCPSPAATPTSGIASCTPTTYGGPDSGSGERSAGRARTSPGTRARRRRFGLKYDATPPSRDAQPRPRRRTRTAGTTTRSPSPSAAPTRPRGSTRARRRATAAPTRRGATVQGTCTDKAGNSASGSFSLQYDSTPPGVTTAFSTAARRERLVQPSGRGDRDGHGHRLGHRLVQRRHLLGPRRADSASLTATCTDKAGNTSTAPVTLQVRQHAAEAERRHGRERQRHGDAALGGLRRTSPASRSSDRPDRTGAAATVYKGDRPSFTDAKLKNGIRYRYQLSATDAAGNVGERQRHGAAARALEPRPGPEGEEAAPAPLGHGRRRRLLQRAALLPAATRC